MHIYKTLTQIYCYKIVNQHFKINYYSDKFNLKNDKHKLFKII